MNDIKAHVLNTVNDNVDLRLNALFTYCPVDKVIKLEFFSNILIVMANKPDSVRGRGRARHCQPDQVTARVSVNDHAYVVIFSSKRLK